MATFDMKPKIQFGSEPDENTFKPNQVSRTSSSSRAEMLTGKENQSKKKEDKTAIE